MANLKKVFMANAKRLMTTISQKMSLSVFTLCWAFWILNENIVDIGGPPHMGPKVQSFLWPQLITYRRKLECLPLSVTSILV
jgi:hypothetical protein